MATTEAEGPRAAAAAELPWLASLQQLLRELPGLVSDRLELASLELQLAGRVLAQIVMLVVAAAILGVTAWLALWGGLLFALIDSGLHWALASLMVLVLNLLACAAAVARARALAPRLRLPATWRHLGVPASTPAAA
jgi:uncharacterized membrane protein YqjE